MRRIAFVIDQKQDFYVALSFLFLLRENMPKENNEYKTVALLTSAANAAEFEPYLNLFDEAALVGRCSIFSWNFLEVRNYVKQFVKNVKRLSLRNDDVLIAFSFRLFFMNVLIKNLKPKPRLITVRKCDYEANDQCTRKKPITSLYWNFFNALYGYSLMKYRWHPETDRIKTLFFVRNPYDFEFCLNPVHSLTNDPRQVPYPYPILRAHAKELGGVSGEPTIIVLGEIYPFWEGMDTTELSGVLNQVLDFLRHKFPTHKLLFKPREKGMKLDLNLEGFTVAFQDISLDSLLLRNLNVEKVISFKSTGSFIATLYGSSGYFLYPMLNISKSIREWLDQFFDPHRKSVIFVNELEDLRKTQVSNPNDVAIDVRRLSQRFVDAVFCGGIP